MNRPLQAPGAADPETIKKLASLGYIGQASPGADAKDLPDPKDRIASLQILKDAGRLTDQHRDDEAAALLRKFTAENPRMLDGWESLARVLRRAGKSKEAIAALEQADRLQPGTPQVVMGLADLHLEDGQYAKARSLAEAARALGSSGVDEELAAIALAEGDVAAAGKYAEAAQAKSPDARLPLLLLGRVATRRGDFAGAIGHFDHALQIEADTHAAPMQGIRARPRRRARASRPRAGGRRGFPARDPGFPRGSRRVVAARAALRRRRPRGGVQGAPRRDDAPGPDLEELRGCGESLRDRRRSRGREPVSPRGRRAAAARGLRAAGFSLRPVDRMTSRRRTTPSSIRSAGVLP